MQYELKHMSSEDTFDVTMTVCEEPSWYDFGKEASYKRYHGSGTTWWEVDTDRRVGNWTSSVLHDLWNKELNRRLEAKNCRV